MLGDNLLPESLSESLPESDTSDSKEVTAYNGKCPMVARARALKAAIESTTDSTKRVELRFELLNLYESIIKKYAPCGQRFFK